jgi:hypothetical protein
MALVSLVSVRDRGSAPQVVPGPQRAIVGESAPPSKSESGGKAFVIISPPICEIVMALLLFGV